MFFSTFEAACSKAEGAEVDSNAGIIWYAIFLVFWTVFGTLAALFFGGAYAMGIRESILRAVKAFTSGQAQSDDITLVVVKRRSAPVST